MPCTITGSLEGDRALEAFQLRIKAQDLNEMLCEVCERLEAQDALNILPESVASWWNDHKELDRRRKEQEDNDRRERIKRLEKELEELKKGK